MVILDIVKSQRPRVLNKNNPNWVNEPGKTIYIGRGSPWGNPYRLTENTRKERHLRINQFKVDFLADEAKVAEAKRILKGANLLCFCDPEPCHGHFLLDLVNPVDEEDLFD